ncbi:hypothetical protein [Streptomyces sp. Y1]|uniref:Uncharacterized protein n=1 Tax=Streptomyces sp. Y1 TaxID=3238634 RepID=A0AB39TPX3_9ACTN
MTDQHNTAPAVWDPTARGGAGGWVRGPQQPGGAEPAPDAAPPAALAATPPATPRPAPQAAPGPVAPPPAAGAVGDQGPPLGARPYLATAPGYDPPTADFPPAAPAAPPFPAHVDPQTPRAGQGYPPPPPAGPPPGYAAQPDQPTDHRPDYPTGYPEPDDEDRPANRRTPLLIGFAVLLVLAIGGGLLLASNGDDSDRNGQAAPAPTAAPASGNPQPAPAPTGSDAAPTGAATTPAAPTATPTPTATTAGPQAQTQAQALNDLLSKGEDAKAPIGSALAKVISCPSKADIENAAKDFDTGAAQRQSLLTDLSHLTVTDLPGGADAVNSLKSAWQLSADADKSYAAWAHAIAQQGCSDKAPTTADRTRADSLSSQASKAKTDFLNNKWKPIATTYGFTVPTQDRI